MELGFLRYALLPSTLGRTCHKNLVKHEETARKSPKEAQAASKTQVKHNFL